MPSLPNTYCFFSYVMASFHPVSPLLLLTLISSFLLFIQHHPSNANSLITCHFEKIYTFGNSLTDTGNLIRENPVGAAAYARLPYGETQPGAAQTAGS
ncbi:hypothetical protein Vadar_010384 [Vaccinium darrowii]|uniref:Uncharacterized protein n=1 Tax=Vaccinium darrowii TaxID=229202 RepID=A0ACB7XYT2_9ERIC|nr:hypothetical protein Vadar_010384 [Vaccinium darrowii]